MRVGKVKEGLADLVASNLDLVDCLEAEVVDVKVSTAVSLKGTMLGISTFFLTSTFC